eukprot:m.43306 g.43306  ORF g.43306 m.43306 type:complete len:154 (+) comp33425_c0_seq11:496-957(+)
MVDQRRAVKYSEDDSGHEKKLNQLWTALMPGEKLESRHTKQWGEIGFQGNNPATDFRGMGILALENLLYFAEEHPDITKQTLSHSHHPKLGSVSSVTVHQLLGRINTSHYCTLQYYNETLLIQTAWFLKNFLLFRLPSLFRSIKHAFRLAPKQ